MKENASDHSASIKDHIIVLISDPVMLTSWREFEIGHRLNIPKDGPSNFRIVGCTSRISSLGVSAIFASHAEPR